MVNIETATVRAAAFLRVCSIALLAFLAACSGTKTDRSEIARPDPLWAQFLDSHTTGLISRRASIRVLFSTDVAAPERIGADASSVFAIHPSVAGTVSFASARALVFTPRGELVPGTTYRVVVKPNGLIGVPADLRPFEFTVTIKRPELDVSLDGLRNDPEHEHAMRVSGVLMTSDAEAPDKVEQIVRATYAGRAVPIEWRHLADGQRHEFVLHGLARGEQAQRLRVSWSGAPIGASNEGSTEIEVPALDRFIVTQVIAKEEGGQRYIAVHFSDALDREQDLKGLVRLSDLNVSTRVDGNVLRVYPDGATDGQLMLVLERGIRNRFGRILEASATYPVVFSSTKPQVRFVGTGTILPEVDTLSVPFEAVGVRSVRVTALRVYDDNLTQFLQVNPLGGSYELGRVGRRLWRKTISLNAADLSTWNRYSLDVTELLKKHPGGLIRLSIAVNRANALYPCEGAAPVDEEPLAEVETQDADEWDNWYYVEEQFDIKDGSTWADRDDPCKDAYYVYNQQKTQAARNLLVSNLGLLAKKDQHGQWIVVATDLRTAEPLADVRIDALDYQRQKLTTVRTDARGMATFALEDAPFMLVAEKDGQKGYLRVPGNAALPVSHFDVGGERVQRGIKGHIYGERGVWRPGDEIHLTFVLQDRDDTLPANHPVTMELFNPQGQLTQTLVNTKPVNGFYTFTLRTAENAPTGNWTAKATLGGMTFSKLLKIETVMPNRLKVALDLERDESDMLRATHPDCERHGTHCSDPLQLRGVLFGQWLNGATAAGLKADVKMRLARAATRFERKPDFVFDDPAREIASDVQDVFEGQLDATGHARIERRLDGIRAAPGMLTATFTSRIFERGGAFSVAYTSHKLSPYQRYVGLKLPDGDGAHNMLRTDEVHTVELAAFTEAGAPTDIDEVEITLYKIDWKWWWDKSGESLAQYTQRTHSSVVQRDTVRIAAGSGKWQFQIKYPAWGRYLLRACDVKGGHCAGQTFYMDWPSWAGSAQEQSGAAANVLVFTADKERYQVGDTATIQLPETKEGRALFTIENGTSVLEARWIDFAKDSNRVTVPITRDMAPNVYVSVTLVQPHAKTNDRPIRLYGIIPLHVTDPSTTLAPVIETAAEWKPESIATVEVSERQRRPMTYTLAVVDEGLLDLTSFKTPNLHEEFYKREALGVTTWDLFDEVAGAYGAELERLLALGGSDVVVKNPDERKTRFPPVVRFLGPFELKAGEKRRHEIDVPQYVGAVRVMVVAGHERAYGSADKSVLVRQPLMLLPTLPRVIGPDEEVAVPVSVFVADKSIKQVRVTMTTDSAFEVVGSDTVQLAFTQPEEQIAMLRLKSKPQIGQGSIKFEAVSGSHRAAAQIHLQVRTPNPPTTQRWQRTLEPGEAWSETIAPHGLAGTNELTLEVSAVPPLDLERRLQFLIQYPYGCLEQITSAVFPQLYLSSLMKLSDERKKEIQDNIHAAIHRLSGYQLPSGGFAYWPGNFYSAQERLRDSWTTSYAGHFLIEAKGLGFAVPDTMLTSWVRHQRIAAQSWDGSSDEQRLDQAYRLYTLALAREPEIGAMNRLREHEQLPPVARWMLAAAYKLAGLQQAADALTRGLGTDVQTMSEWPQIFGSQLRDQAMMLSALVTLQRDDQAEALADEISRALRSDAWYSTQSTAFALMAMAHYIGLEQFAPYTFEYAIDGRASSVSVDAPMYRTSLDSVADRGATVRVHNPTQRRLFATLTARGVPASGTDTADAQGLTIDVHYLDEDGNAIDVTRLSQGSDLIARIVVTNTTPHRIENIALAQLVPAGWEIHNERMEGFDPTGERKDSAPLQPSSSGPRAASANVEHVDIRDDRIYHFFSLQPRERLIVTTRLNAAYRGRFYLPSIVAEAMYDSSRFARTKGQWVEVVE
ncbi:MAG: MG2 domain-containing protein [Gammaproteobacteria bacterium]